MLAGLVVGAECWDLWFRSLLCFMCCCLIVLLFTRYNIACVVVVLFATLRFAGL